MIVGGEGPQPCVAMIVGEAPGRDEVAQGRPFVGKSGKLLETALRACGVSRDDTYITNVVKELPLDYDGKIRRPYDDEIEEWASILEGEIYQCAPKAILSLGRTAAKALLGAEIGSQAPFSSKIGNIFMAWHPSFVLHTGGQTQGEWLEQIKPWAEAIHED